MVQLKLVLCRMATCYAFTTFSRNDEMINPSPTGEYIENPLILGIGIAYIAFLVAYAWWNNRNDKNP